MKMLLGLLILQAILSSSTLAAEKDSVTPAFQHCNKYPMEDDGIRIFMRDIAQELGRRLNASVEHLTAPMKRCFGMLKTGEVDFMLYANPTDERSKFVDFLHPSTSSDVVFMVRKEDGDWIHSFSDLENKTLGLVNGYSYFPKLHADNKINKMGVVYPTQLPKILMARRVDAFISFEGIANNTLLGYSDIIMSSYRVNQFVTDFIVISKESPLHHRLDEVKRIVVGMINDGYVETILKKHMPGLMSPFSKSAVAQ